MTRKKAGFSLKLAISISILILSASLILGYILAYYSKTGMKTLINNRMLDISKTAADFIDGDILEKIQKEDKDTEEYKKIYNILAVFQNNINLKYIYCVRDLGNKRFVFTVDPSPTDPGEFGQPIVYTDALYQASLGKSAVDKEPYTDAWGRFYSAYSPVFNSSGKVAGIVAVDFEASWYEEEMAKQNKVIWINSFINVLLGILLIIIFTGNLRKQLAIITSDIGEVVKNVKEITNEINPNAIKKESESESNDDIQELGKRILLIKDDLKQYIDNLHIQANSMINALSSNYHAVYYIDLDKNEGVCYQSHSQLKNGLKEGEHFSFSEAVLAYAKAYIVDKYLDEFLRFTDINEVKKALQKEKRITIRYKVKRNGKESYEMGCLARVKHPDDKDDDVVHAIGAGFADVDAETRRTLASKQALNDALNVAEGANKAKTAFLSNMSHEIRTPMNVIIGLDRIALNDSSISETTRKYLEKIGYSAKHLLGLINDILDMSRIEAGRMVLKNELFSLSDLLKQVDIMIGEQCRDKGLNWKLENIGEIQDYYIGDDMKLKQILINLLGNSVKFTPKEGNVSLTVESVTSFNNKSMLRFYIKDTGIGMSEDFLPKLYEPFTQEDIISKSKYGSTGLGMAITKSIVEMMNGDIKVKSKKGVGTTFTVSVTLINTSQKINKIGEINPNELKILIIDDDPVACKYEKIELEKVGIIPDICNSKQDAIEKIKVKSTRSESYNLILIDWKMLEIDGIETSKQISSIAGNDSVIIIITSLQWDDIFENAVKLGINNISTKPLNVDHIIQLFNHTYALKTKDKKNKVDLDKCRILVAEDMAINAEILGMILKMRNIESDFAENGKIAVEKFSSHPKGYYDAILMDMKMPVMDGLEATRTIRGLDRPDSKSIPIIALTANAFDEDVQRSLQAGLNAHLSKPIEPENLFETLEKLISNSSD